MIYEFFRWLAILTCFPFQLILFKRKTYYEDRADWKRVKKGGALVISNHFNFLDYLMNMFVVLPRKLNVVASEDPFRSKLLTFGMKFFGAIQANRITKDMRFMDQCAAVIRKGQLVQIFPEGRNTDDGTIKPFKQSYIVIAHRADAPIIPIVTDGNYGFFKQAHVMVGRSIRVSDYITSKGRTPTREERERVNEMIYGEVLRMRRELEERKSFANKRASAERRTRDD